MYYFKVKISWLKDWEYLTYLRAQTGVTIESIGLVCYKVSFDNATLFDEAKKSLQGCITNYSMYANIDL
jgi:hypothetical protein